MRWVPTNKWLVATVTAVGGLAVVIETSGWHASEKIMVITLVTQRLVAYLTPNSEKEAA